MHACTHARTPAATTKVTVTATSCTLLSSTHWFCYPNCIHLLKNKNKNKTLILARESPGLTGCIDTLKCEQLRFSQVCCVKYQSWGCLYSLPCCFSPTETVRTIKDGEPKTSTSSFTSSSSILLYVHRDLRLLGTESPGGPPPRLSRHSSWALTHSSVRFNVVYHRRPQRPYIYITVLRHWSQLVPNMSNDIWGH